MKFVAGCTELGNFWELEGEVLSFRIVVERQDEYYAVYPYFSRYTGEEEKQVRRLLAKGEEAYKDFVEKHFIKFVGVLPKHPAVHKQQVKSFPVLRDHMYQEGVQGIKSMEPDQLGDELMDDDTVSIPFVQDLYSPVSGREIPIRVEHRMSLDDRFFQMYESAIHNELSKGGVSIKVDWDTVERIYDEAVISLTGYLVGGKPCTDRNKQDWVGKVPFEHKYSVVDEVFKPIALD